MSIAAAPATSVLFITPYYRPEIIGSGPFCADMAEWLVAHARPVRVLTTHPHYPLRDAFGGRRAAREAINGVAVERLGIWTPRSRSTAGRIASEVLFLLAGLWALLRGRVTHARLVLSLCPSILGVALGILTTRRDGHHVAIVHDIQSGLAEGLGMAGGSWLARAIALCERSVLNRVDLVAVLSHEMRHRLRALGVHTPIEVMPIWADTDAVFPLPEPEGEPAQVIYSGNLGRKQGLGQVVALALELQQRRPDVQIVIRGIGGERDALAELVRARSLTNVRFADLLPAAALNEGLSRGRLYLVPQAPAAADCAVPSKVFNIMAAGRSFVATAAEGTSLWHLQQASEAFVCVPPNDSAAFVAAVLRLVDDTPLRRELGARAQRFILRHHAKQKVLGDFTRLLDDLQRG